MKEILEPIASVIYDSLVKLCLYFQGVFDSMWLIVLSAVFIIATIFCFLKQCKEDFGNNRWIQITSGLLLVAFCSLFFSIGWEDFKLYNELDDSVTWILITAVWVLSLIHIIVCYYYHKVLYSILFVIGLILAMIFFSKFFVYLAVIFVLGAVSGKAQSGHSGETTSSSWSNVFSSNDSNTTSSNQTVDNKITDNGYHPKAYFQVEWKHNGQPLTFNANFHLPVDATVSDFVRELHKLHGGEITIVSYRRGNEPTVYLE